jgi:antitoxin VapB
METHQIESELNVKLGRIRTLLARLHLDAILLRQTGNFAWVTCGADSHINTADSLGVASLLITPSGHFVITNNIEADRLMHEAGLEAQGWEFQVSPWFGDTDRISELSGRIKLGADTCLPNALDLSAEIVSLRSALTPEEDQRFRNLGKACAHGMRNAIDSVHPGMTEFEIAADLYHAVEGEGVQATVVLVATDERIFSYRHPLPTAKQLQKYAMLVLCGRKDGLVCSLTRLVHFGPLPAELRRKAEAVARIDAGMIAATRPNKTIGDVFRKAQELYAATGFPEEWQLHHQGGSAGYAPREVTATPASVQPILVGQAFAWNPSITGTKSEDTILIGRDQNEIITEMSDWPAIDVQVGDHTIKRPAIFER